MAKRVKDLAVKTGTYQDSTGATKNRYTNLGVMMQGDDGGNYILLDPLVNLAAVPREAGKDRIMVSMFDPREDGRQQAAPTRQAAPQRQAAPAEDEIPF